VCKPSQLTGLYNYSCSRVCRGKLNHGLAYSQPDRSGVYTGKGRLIALRANSSAFTNTLGADTALEDLTIAIEDLKKKSSGWKTGEGS